MYTPTFLSYQLYHTFAKIRDLNKIFLTDSAKQWIILHSNHMWQDSRLYTKRMTGAGESYERVSKKEKYYLFSEAIRNRCAWCNGAGTVCIASDRYDHQHTRRTAWYRNPCNSRRLCERSNRSCDGNLDRSSTSVSATCIVFTGGSRNGSKWTWGCRRTSCGFGRYDFCSRIWKTGFKRNKNRYYCDTICDDLCGGSAFTGMCTGDRSSGKYRRNCDHVGDWITAIFHGNYRICDCWYCADTSNQQCSDLCGTFTYRACRRCCCSRLLCTDGWFCGYEF